MQIDRDRIHQGRILLGCFLGAASGYSSAYFYSSGLLLIPISRDLGLSRGEATLSIFASSMIAAIMAPLLGRAVDRHGGRLIGLLALVGLAASLVICTWLTQGLATLLLSAMLIALLGAGSTSVSFSRLVVDAFDRRRGLALAVMQTGVGLGAFTIPFILSSELQDGDWRGAYRLLALIVIASTAVVAGLIGLPRSRISGGLHSTAPAFQVRGWDIWSTRPFLILTATFCLAAAAISASVVHFVPMMVDGGLSTTEAAHLASLLGITLICGRLTTGWLLDHLIPEYVAAALFVITAIGLSVIAIEGASVAVPGALIVGLAIGSEVDLLCYLTARHFPREHYGTAYGGLFGVFLFGSAIGPSVMGFLYDHSGSYLEAFLFASGVLVIAAALVAILRKACPLERGSALASASPQPATEHIA